MTRLEKYLVATASEMIQAETTVSRYFTIGNIKVRMSDHYSSTSDAEMQIIVPFNGGTNYLVTVSNSPGKFVSWNAKQIKEFIPHLQVIRGLRASIKTSSATPSIPAAQKVQIALSDNPVEVSSLTLKGERIKSKLKERKLSARQLDVFRKEKTTWNAQQIAQVSGMVTMELGSNKGFNEDVQIFLSCTSTTYEDFLNIFKLIVVDNKKTPSITLLQEANTLIQQQYEKNI